MALRESLEFGPKFQKMLNEIVLKTNVFRFVPETFAHELCPVLNLPNKIG
jgi:hypothetical protein